MVLDELLSTIDELQTLIRAHGDELRHSEMATRYALINPLLRALGWKTQDPTHVGVEKRLKKSGGSKEGKADYLLRGKDGRSVVLIEAKKLGGDLSGARSQASDYCNQNAIPCYAVTDGQHWYLYETRHGGPNGAKQVVHFDIAGDPTAVAVMSLALWQRNIEQKVLANIVTTPASPPSPRPQTPKTVSGQRIYQWRPVNSLLYMWGTRPHLVRLPDHTQRGATTYPELLCVIAEWLAASGKLNASQLPIKSMQGNRLIAVGLQQLRPTIPSGTWRKIDSMYVEIPTSSATLTANVCRLIATAGLEPADFKVQLSRP